MPNPARTYDPTYATLYANTGLWKTHWIGAVKIATPRRCSVNASVWR